MDKKDEKTEETTHRLMDLLNRALRLEYSLIVHYPRLANTIKDEETRKLVLQLGSASIRHADVVANTISQLGGEPDWSIELYPEDMDTVKIFQTQLEKEKLALQLHRESADLVPSSSLRGELSALAVEEEQHIKIVNHILSRL
jgi:rubrerythrin